MFAGMRAGDIRIPGPSPCDNCGLRYSVWSRHLRRSPAPLRRSHVPSCFGGDGRNRRCAPTNRAPRRSTRGHGNRRRPGRLAANRHTRWQNNAHRCRRLTLWAAARRCQFRHWRRGRLRVSLVARNTPPRCSRAHPRPRRPHRRHARRACQLPPSRDLDRQQPAFRGLRRVPRRGPRYRRRQSNITSPATAFSLAQPKSKYLLQTPAIDRDPPPPTTTRSFCGFNTVRHQRCSRATPRRPAKGV